MDNDNNSSINNFPPAKKKLHFGLGLWRVQRFYKDLQKKIADEGVVNVAKESIGRRQMEKAAWHLNTIEAKQPGKSLRVYFLTGKKFWYQTVFCAYSLAQQSDRDVHPVVFDDGSLDPHHIKGIKRIFPKAEIVSPTEVLTRLDQRLPESRFPTLRGLRHNFALIRKLTDVHASSPGWKLYLDSDMLFFRRPTFLLEWLDSPTKSCYMKDVRTAYSYDDETLTGLTKTPMLECVNTGITGLNSDDMNWDQLEFWCKTLIEKDGLQYFLEQGLTAMYFSVYASCAVPENDYVVFPAREEVNKPYAVLHHYVGETKSWYFQFGWKNVYHKYKKNAD
jgi:hypothetical protein